VEAPGKENRIAILTEKGIFPVLVKIPYRVKITMMSGVQEKVIRRLRAAGGIEVRVGGGPTELVLSVQGAETRLILEVKQRFTDALLDEIESRPAETRDRTVVVVPALPEKRRRELRFGNISWIEYQTGVVHLRVPHLAIDLPEDPQAEPRRPRALPSLSGKAGIVVEALVQLAERQDLVSQPEVAELSGSTQAWTSKIFSALVEAGALEVEGSGPSKQWRPRAEALLRLWETDGGPSPSVTSMYMWSRTPEDLIRSVARVGDVTTDFAIGGVAAANLHEPTLSATPVVTVWIPASLPPAKIATALDADLVESGANVLLWQASGDPALRLAAQLRTWRENAPEGLGRLSVVTPARAVVEALQGTGRSREVGQALRQRILSETGDS